MANAVKQRAKVQVKAKAILELDENQLKLLQEIYGEAKSAVATQKKLIGNPQEPWSGSLLGILRERKSTLQRFNHFHNRVHRARQKKGEKHFYAKIAYAIAKTNEFMKRHFDPFCPREKIKAKLDRMRAHNSIILGFWKEIFRNEVYKSGESLAEIKNHMAVFDRALQIVWWRLNDFDEDLDYLLAEMPRLFKQSNEYKSLVRDIIIELPVPQPKPGKKIPVNSAGTTEIPRVRPIKVNVA